jgi:hypothetical protein
VILVSRKSSAVSRTDISTLCHRVVQKRRSTEPPTQWEPEDRGVNIFTNTHLLFRIKMCVKLILTLRTFSLYSTELNTRKTLSSYSPSHIGSICHCRFDVSFHKIKNLFWAVITYSVISMVVIVIEGKLKKRSLAHGVSHKVNTVFSEKIVYFLASQMPLAYTPLYNRYLPMPTLVRRTPSLQIHGVSSMKFLRHIQPYILNELFLYLLAMD